MILKIMPPPLEFIKVSKYYDDLCAVDNVSLSIEPGEIFGLLGPNGAGKTTCISMITTLSHPSEGEIRVFGKRLQEEPQACKQMFGVVPQEMVTHGFFNVEEILRFHSGYYGISQNQAWLRYLLKKLQLYAHRKKLVRQLSGGMKKRLLIAKALVHRPPLVLMDEPTAGVDIELRDTLWSFMNELKAEGCTLLLTTHYLEEAEELCDRVAVIHHGKIQKLSPTRELVDELTQREITLLLAEDPGRVKSPHLVAHVGRELVFRAPSAVALSGLLREAGIDASLVKDVRTRDGNLEDAVRHLIQMPQRRSSS